MSNETFDISSLLEGTLDDLDDMPTFAPWPPGAHLATIKWEMQKEKKGYNLQLKYLSSEELADPTNTPPKAGDETTVGFNFTNEWGQGAFKEVMKPLAEHYGTAKNIDTINASNGATVLVVTDLKAGKKQPGQTEARQFMGIKQISVV